MLEVDGLVPAVSLGLCVCCGRIDNFLPCQNYHQNSLLFLDRLPAGDLVFLQMQQAFVDITKGCQIF